MANTALVSVRVKGKQAVASLLVLIVFGVGLAGLHLSNRGAFMPGVFGFLFGYVLQRSRFCFAAGFRDIFLIRNTSLTRAVLIAIALTTFGFTALNFGTGINLEMSGKVFPAGIHTVAGGFIFGFGMVIAGSCVSGCLVRVGEGYIMQWCTLLGLLAGSAAGAWNLNWWWPAVISRAPAVFLPRLVGWPLALALQYGMIFLLYRLALKLGRESGQPRRLPLRAQLRGMFGGRQWTYFAGAVVLAFLNVSLFYTWKHPWSITGGLAHFSGWLSCRVGLSPLSWGYFRQGEILDRCSRELFLSHPLIYLSLAMIAGSLFASLSRREFRWRRPRNYKYILSAILGGLLMGYSSRISLGCNIGAFLSGTASLSVHGWLFGLSLLPGAALGGKYLMHFLVE